VFRNLSQAMVKNTGVQETLQLERSSSTVNLSLESRAMTRKAQSHLSLRIGQVQDGTGEAGVK